MSGFVCLDFECINSEDINGISDNDSVTADSDSDTDSDTDSDFYPDMDFYADTDNYTDEDSDELQCVEGERRTVACSTDSSLFQIQICNEFSRWEDSGECSSVFAEMVTVPAGSFWMGCNESYDSACNDNEYPYHKIILPEYKIDKYEVTVSDYQKCIDNGACSNKNKEHSYYENTVPDCNLIYNKSESEPVNCVSWYGAKAYCEWIGMRLPTEAEWEKAARGTDSRIYPWGNEEADCHHAIMFEPFYQVGPYQEGGPGCGEGRPLQVGSRFGKSPYSAYDMAGNVWEWVNDWYQEDYYLISPEKNPEGPESGSSRIVRGGSWDDSSKCLRASVRTRSTPVSFFDTVGFRCAVDTCNVEDERFINCAEDSSKLQKQICDINGFWNNTGACFCQSGTEQKVNCSTESMKYQRQVCGENGNWQDKGECFCEKGMTKVIPCSTEVTKFQNQTCNGQGEWENEGSCFESFSSVLCSGQIKCYDNEIEILCPFEENDFYGQDYQYASSGFCIPKNFSVSGTDSEKIISDGNTSLQWQGILPETYIGCAAGKECTWPEAVDYCESLNYGGFDNWRLPSMEELDTVIDYGKYDPAFNENYFPATSSKYFVSSTSTADNLDNAWYFSAVNGSDGEYIETTAGSVMCVRGDNLLQHNFTEETLNGGRVTTDSITGLQWAENPEKKMMWMEALDYCETLDYAGYADWRLPDINELKSVVNRKKYNPASDISGISVETFWSSTSSSSNPVYAFCIDINYGLVKILYKLMNDQNVLCVRSLRSDPVYSVYIDNVRKQ
ncbi:MAG TPA: SUMF1/EgtB/PvdO family nonheme iron enzyme [bacterium]|nr:SUMF1/EgtB/PvdO family nonheme iron enzyme [bacterium]